MVLTLGSSTKNQEAQWRQTESHRNSQDTSFSFILNIDSFFFQIAVDFKTTISSRLVKPGHADLTKENKKWNTYITLSQDRSTIMLPKTAAKQALDGGFQSRIIILQVKMGRVSTKRTDPATPPRPTHKVFQETLPLHLHDVPRMQQISSRKALHKTLKTSSITSGGSRKRCNHQKNLRTTIWIHSNR